MEEKDTNYFFDNYIYGWMFSDIKICLDNRANFACALLICCGIDAIGSFQIGRGHGFTEFIKRYFPNGYSSNAEFKNIIRHGLVHEYFPKNKSAIGKGHGNQHLKNFGEGLYIDTEVFFGDFKKAVKNYRNDLKTDINLQKMFVKRYNKIFLKSNCKTQSSYTSDFQRQVMEQGSSVSVNRY